MALSTYSELRSAALNVVGREGDAALVAYVPVAVDLAHAKINGNLQVGQMEASTTGTSTNGVLALPSDFLSARRVEAVPYGPLEFLTPEAASSYYPGTSGGSPAYYTIQGTNLVTYPPYTGNVSLDYYQQIPALSDSNPTNWLLAVRPDIYLFLTVSELYAFAKNYEEASVWNQRGMTAVEEVMRQDMNRRYANASIRVKGPTP